MQTHVEFRSDRFPAYDGEEQQVNPGRWGRRLAEFLRDNLRKEGFQAQELVAEDWGWMLPIENDQFPLWIGCGNYEEYADGFLCFIEPHTPFVRRLLWPAPFFETVLNFDTHRSLQMTSVCAHAGAA